MMIAKEDDIDKDEIKVIMENVVMDKITTTIDVHLVLCIFFLDVDK